jgi:hypothetical protein
MIYIIYILQQSMGSLPMDAVRSRPEEREREREREMDFERISQNRVAPKGSE